MIIGKKTDSDWLAKRKIGSSDVSTILGLNPYETPFGLWLQLTGQAEPEDLSEKETIKWGNILEPIIAREAGQSMGFEAVENFDVYAHDKFNYLTATPDYWITGNEKQILEIKNSSLRMAQLWEEGLPDHAHVQVLHQMFVTGVHLATVAALVGGNKLVTRNVEYDEKLVNLILEKLEAFWGLVQTKQAPALTSGDSDKLSLLYPESMDLVVDSPAMASVVEKLQAVKSEIKLRTDEKETLEAEIKAKLKEANTLKAGAYEVTWKTQTRAGLDTVAFKKELPTVYAKYEKTSSFRVMRIK